MRIRERTLAVCTLLVVGAIVGACAPDPLTTEQRMDRLMLDNRQLQLELIEKDRRIAELAGGQTSTVPQKPPESVRMVQAVIHDPFKAVSIAISPVTGGFTDGQAADVGVRVVFSPMDRFGSKVKRAGSAEIDLYDLAEPRDRQLVGHWAFTEDQMVENWVGGFGTNAYVLELIWPNGKPPAHRNLTLLVRFKTLDGRNLEAPRAFAVKLPGDAVEPATAPAPATTSRPATDAGTAPTAPTVVPVVPVE